MDRGVAAVQDAGVSTNGSRAAAVMSGGLEAARWSEYLESLSLSGDHHGATVVLPAANGSGDEPARPLHAIRYDADRDEIELAVGIGIGPRAALRYFLSAPRSIHIDELDGAKVLRVQDVNGQVTVVHISRRDVAHSRSSATSRRTSV
jgi:hypothetical protein